MTDFEKCCEDLMRWHIGFEEGEWNDEQPKMKYIYTGCDYIKFDMNGNYLDTE